MEIRRDAYLDELLSKRWNGLVKVITGIRRCGKSYLLKTLFRRRLLEEGVKEESIITFELDTLKDVPFRNPFKLVSTVRSIIGGSSEEYYLFIDEIQMSSKLTNPDDRTGRKITFYDALNDLMTIPNLDIYVTGSNSEMLSDDILTNFRGRSDRIHMHPLCFKEFHDAVGGDARSTYEAYSWYGGMPLVLSRPDEKAKQKYLANLFDEIYIKDLVERVKIQNQEALEGIINLLCSAVGSLTNPQNITDALRSSKIDTQIARSTVAKYMKALENAYLFTPARRYDVKGKAYFDSPIKYYAEDVGLRNSRLGFRQQEPTHIMENIIFNELICRGCSVDVGLVNSTETRNGKRVNVAREIDFIAHFMDKRVYIQSAYSIPDDEKKQAENYPFSKTGDNFMKILVRADITRRWYDEHGVLNIGVVDFLLDKNLF